MLATRMRRFYATKTGLAESDGWSVADSRFGLFVAQALDREDAEAICASLNGERPRTAPFLRLVPR